MKKTILFSTFVFICVSLFSQAVSIEIKGDNYGIQALEKDQLIFFNRSNLKFGTIPSDYLGWKCTKINANSSWQSGPLPAFQVRPSGNGYIYAIVADLENADVCEQWATANNWEKIPGQQIVYGSNEWEKFSFYKKQSTKDTWISVAQPNVFSGAIIIAPEIKEEGTGEVPEISAVEVSIKSVGFVETDRLNNGVLAFANRTYVFNSVHANLQNLYFTRNNGGSAPKLRVTTLEDGNMYIAVSNEDRTYDPSENGFTEVEGLKFKYNDPNGTIYTVYKKVVFANEELAINATGWQGVMILSSKEIKYSIFNNFTPPPGVVVHNSKANTKKYIGSPSIVVLEDGTYLASHDYFGTRTECFVYKSADKGETWERISNILDLKWASIFRRGNEIYLLGVRVDGTEYGNTVILKSTDNGVTWTNPIGNKTGLLLQGYYHCAPVPVVWHNGKIWRAMERMGTPGGWGGFKSFMMSIDENADLLDAANWDVSNELLPGENDYSGTWLEGNAVIAKDGSMKNILRVHYGSDDICAIIDVSDDGKTQSFNVETGFTYLPGALKKFTIRYDEVSEKYWTLSSYVLPKDRGGNLERTRNTIALCSSTNLRDWKVVEILLHHPSIGNHGFQYLDWLFEGDDIIAVSRTAWDDETGQADSQHNANYITFHRFKNFRFEKPTTDTGVSIKRWFNDAKSAIALTFDDGFKAHYEQAYPILKENGIPATFFVNSGNLVNKREEPKERYGFWEDFKEMAENGYEIASHSVSHPDLTALALDELIRELEEDKRNIELNIEKPCLTHAYPYCKHDEAVNVVASSLFIAGRECGGMQNDASIESYDLLNIKSDLLTWTYPRSVENETASFNSFKTSFENTVRRNRNFGVLCIHEVLPFTLLSTSATYEIATTEWLMQVCQYLKEKEESGDIWPATFADIIRYGQERDKVRIKKNDIDAETISYEFSIINFLDTTIYNFPLTISVTVPDDWNKIQYKIMEGSNVVCQENVQAERNQITLNIIPEKQTLYITKQEESVIAETIGSNFFVYPNPVTDRLNAKLSIATNGILEVFNMQGTCVFKQSLNPNSTTNSFDISTLSEGLYLLKIENQIQKLIKK